MCSLNARNEGWSVCSPESEIEKIRCRADGFIMGSLIDTCSKVHDNARKSDMQEYECCLDRPPLIGMAIAAHLIVWQI